MFGPNANTMWLSVLFASLVLVSSLVLLSLLLLLFCSVFFSIRPSDLSMKDCGIAFTGYDQSGEYSYEDSGVTFDTDDSDDSFLRGLVSWKCWTSCRKRSASEDHKGDIDGVVGITIATAATIGTIATASSSVGTIATIGTIAVRSTRNSAFAILINLSKVVRTTTLPTATGGDIKKEVQVTEGCSWVPALERLRCRIWFQGPSQSSRG